MQRLVENIIEWKKMIELTKNAIDEPQTRGQGMHPRNNAVLLTSGIKLSILTEHLPEKHH